MIFQLGTKQNRYFAGDFAVTILQLNKPNHRQNYCHFIFEEIETQRDPIACPILRLAKRRAKF